MDSTFSQTEKIHMPEIFQNVQREDYQGAESKSFFQICK